MGPILNKQKKTDTNFLSFSFDGSEITCQSGVSIGAALTAADHFGLRKTPLGDRRGIFCGMGVCQECRVIVDGEHSVRACMTPARSSSTVLTGDTHISDGPTELPVVDIESVEIVTPDLLVVGAGPAGAIAASIAAEAGLDVSILDERHSIGGQYYKQPASPNLMPESLTTDKQFSGGRRLIKRLMKSGASVQTGVQIWGAFTPNELAVYDGVKHKIFRAKKTIVATGAYERGLPVSGWTLPGVMTTGAAQALLRSYGILPGQRILVAGNGPLNLQAALELSEAGAEVIGVAELGEKPGVAALFSSGLKMGLNSPRLAFNGLRYLLSLKKLGVPIFYGHRLESIEKKSTGLKVRIVPTQHGSLSSEYSWDVDTVCMGYGFQPSNEILRSLGCSHAYDENRGHLVTNRNYDCETSVPGIYAIGDCTGLRGAPSALLEGVIASISVLKSMDKRVSFSLMIENVIAVIARYQHKVFQSALWKLFDARRYHFEFATSDTIVCRCENVNLGDIEQLLDNCAGSIGYLKRQTRLGMGPCQGRYCAPVAAAMIAKHYQTPIDEFSFFAPQVPLKPIRIADIVSGKKT
ncbi:MAG: hypothetical protein CMO98_11540 [Woeseia sp.]|nr:hypothetical protein [Woeseia sp.]